MPHGGEGDRVGLRDLDVGPDERPGGPHRRVEPTQLAAAEPCVGRLEIQIDRGRGVEAGERRAHGQIADGVVFDRQLGDAAGHAQGRSSERPRERQIDSPLARQNERRGQMAARQAPGRGRQIRRLDPCTRLHAPVIEGAVSVHRGARCAGAKIGVCVFAAGVDVEVDGGDRRVAHQLGEIELAHPDGETRRRRAQLGEIEGALGIDPTCFRRQAKVGLQPLRTSVVVSGALERDGPHVNLGRGRADREGPAAHGQGAQIDDDVRAAGGGRRCLRWLRLRRLRRGQRPGQIRRVGSAIAEDEPELGTSNLQPPQVDVPAQQRPDRKRHVDPVDPRHLGPLRIA